MDFGQYPYRLLAAKSSPDGRWLPYYAHLLDTAGIMEHLVNEWLPRHIIDTMSERNSYTDWNGVCTFIALTHDIGKATPIFQSRICERNPSLKEKIERHGIILPFTSQYMDASKTPHALAGESILLNAGCPAGIAAIVGTHHGTPASAFEDVEDMTEIYEENFFGCSGMHSEQGGMWEDARKKWIDMALKYSGYGDISELPCIDVSSQLILSGLLVMADWIASNERYMPLIDLDDEREPAYPERTDEAWREVAFPDQWMPSCRYMDDEAFIERFTFVPNEMQRCFIDAVQDSLTPGIYILEAPMGQGKTEAALAASEILASKWDCEGVFMGLPTQATANGIFPRVKTWIEGQTQGDTLSIRLAHGAAELNKEYGEIFHGNARQNEDCDGGLIVHSWFEGRKQALLSSFVIGTVDQLLMAALQQKHVMLRQLGLAGKVVVIDECHAYDAYMSCYLERALEWMGILNVPVILLSATLPSKQRAKFIEAYSRKCILREPDGWRDNTSYPLLTYTDNGCVCQRSVKTTSSHKEIKIIRMNRSDMIQTLKVKLSGGGCAGIIMNTVTQAQDMAHVISEQMPDYTVILIHARFTQEARQRLEADILRRLGKNSVPNERNLIVVGTQILEQSLDIDFDIMVTQPVPMDLMLQRIGRLHRHGGRLRPEQLREATCMVIDTDEPDEASQKIYGEWLIGRTIQILPDRIILPNDIPPLVREAYSDLTESNVLYPCYEAHLSNMAKKERRANSHRIPSEDELEETMHGLLDSNIGDSDIAAQARVRDGESALSVLLMMQCDDEYAQFLSIYHDGTDGLNKCNKGNEGFVGEKSNKDNEGFAREKSNKDDEGFDGQKISMSHVPTADECRRIAMQKVQLPRILGVYRYDECVNELEQRNREYLCEWQRSNLLCGELVMLLDSQFSTELCGYSLRYDLRYGLICKKEGEHGGQGV